MSLMALVAAIRPKSKGSSTIGIKKSVVDTTPRASSIAYTAASSREALPTHSRGSRFCKPLPATITSRSFGEILQPQPAPWLYCVKRIGSVICSVISNLAGFTQITTQPKRRIHNSTRLRVFSGGSRPYNHQLRHIPIEGRHLQCGQLVGFSDVKRHRCRVLADHRHLLVRICGV